MKEHPILITADYARKAFDRIGFSHGEAHIAVMSAKPWSMQVTIVTPYWLLTKL